MLLLFFPSLALAGSQDYLEVSGYANIVAGRQDLARESALRNALRSAVEQVVGVMIQSESVVDNFALVKDKLATQSAGFIRRYSIIDEKCTGELCSVQVKALVSRSKLEKGLESLGLTLKKMGKPRMVLLLSEQSALQDRPSFWWGGDAVDLGVAESTFTARFLKQEFNFVDRQSILGNLRERAPASKLAGNLSNDQALSILAAGEADVAIIGQAFAKAGGTVAGTSFRPCQGTVSARAVNVDNGELLASCSATATVPHVNAATGGALALEKAAGECAEKLSRQVVDKWQKRIGGAGMVRLTVSGLEYRELQEFSLQLKERLDQVEEIYERSFGGDKAKMDLEVSGNARQLAAELAGMRFSWGGVKVISLSANVIELQTSRK